MHKSKRKEFHNLDYQAVHKYLFVLRRVIWI